MRYFRAGSIILIVISVSHLAGHFFLLPHLRLVNNITGELPANETERTLLQLMNEYHKNVSGASLSMMDLQNGLSLCYALFFLWTGILNLVMAKGLMRNKRLLAQISLLNSVILFIGAIVAVKYFFWLPIASFVLAGMSFVVAAVRLRNEF